MSAAAAAAAAAGAAAAAAAVEWMDGWVPPDGRCPLFAFSMQLCLVRTPRLRTVPH